LNGVTTIDGVERSLVRRLAVIITASAVINLCAAAALIA
jgi:hypothetical protein